MSLQNYEEIDWWEGYFEKQVWYSRHMLREHSIDVGRIILVHSCDPTISIADETIPIEVWRSALEAKEKIAAELNGEVGPWDDYKWGVINGKLSALRWVLDCRGIY